MNITKIIMAFGTLIMTVITCFVIPLIRSKTNAETFSQIQFWTTIAVEAAEQIYNQPGMGKDKKAYVVQFLKDKGFSIDEEMIDNMIEAAVLELKNALSA